MLHAFFVLLSLITDYETMTGMTQSAIFLGLANAGVLCCIGAGLAARHWSTRGRAS
jgi:hypothetical protein